MSSWKKGLGLVLVVLTIAVLLFAIRFARATSLFSTLEEVDANCRVIEAVPGPEDIVIDRARGFAYVSATDRRILRAGGAAASNLRGGIYLIDLNAPPERWALVPVTPTSPESFRPHGLGLFVDEDGERSLFVVNHPADDADEVVILDIDDEGRLSHRRTVSDPLLTNLNDVQPVARDRFYATNDHAAGTSKALQDFLMLDRANLVYFDGTRARVAAEGLTYANGVNVSSDRSEVYVAETLDRTLRIYDRDIGSGDLELTDVVRLGASVDNIDVLENGDLLIGAHPKILDFAKHAEDSAFLSPSQVVRVSRNTAGAWSARTLYLDKGDEVSGVAAAAGYGDVMLLGPVFQSKVMVCSQVGRP